LSHGLAEQELRLNKFKLIRNSCYILFIVGQYITELDLCASELESELEELSDAKMLLVVEEMDKSGEIKPPSDSSNTMSSRATSEFSSDLVDSAKNVLNVGDAMLKSLLIGSILVSLD